MALTPGPSPALRERGDPIRGIGIVVWRRRRIAIATQTTLPLPVEERTRAQGKTRGRHQQPVPARLIKPPSGRGGNPPLPVRKRAGQATSEAPVEGPHPWPRSRACGSGVI